LERFVRIAWRERRWWTRKKPMVRRHLYSSTMNEHQNKRWKRAEHAGGNAEYAHGIFCGTSGSDNARMKFAEVVRGSSGGEGGLTLE